MQQGSQGSPAHATESCSLVGVLGVLVMLRSCALQVDITQVWLTLSSVVLAFVFIFGNNIRNLYESVIFLFIVHPFDVGDCLLIAEAWHTVGSLASTAVPPCQCHMSCLSMMRAKDSAARSLAGIIADNGCLSQ